MLKNLTEDYVKTYKTKADTGRSMLEILAVLAIIGILSIAAITGYTYAMSKHKANQIYKQVDLRAVESFSNPALVNYEPGAKYNLIGFEKELSDISYSQEKGFNKKFYVIVKKVPVRVCKMLQKMVLEDFPIEREVFLCQGDLNATECMGAVSECEEGENNTFVFAYDIGVRGTLNIPDPDPEPDPCPNGKMFGSFCCHNEFIENEECCTNDNETWKTDSKTCCEAKYHHWVNKETMVETETDDANGMCCINSSEYVFTSQDRMCCNLNQAVSSGYCCPEDYETLSEESTIEKKIACCEAAGRNWESINGENFKCCEKGKEPVIVDSDIVCCPSTATNVINGTCCPSTATGVVDGECCTITKVVQDTDTGEEETICCDNPLDPRCTDEGENDLEDPVPTDEETCISEGGEWIQKENETPYCCTLTQIRNTQTCCEAAGYTWNGEKEEDKCTAEKSCRIIGDLNTKETTCWISSVNSECSGEDCSRLNTDCRPGNKTDNYDNGPFFSTGCEGGEVNSSAAPVCSKATHNNVLALSYQVPCPSGTFCKAQYEDRNRKKKLTTDTPKALYGTCQQIGGYVEEGKYIRSDIMLNWWSAGAWCLANGKKWASIGGDLCPNWAGGSVTDLGCYSRLDTGEGLTEDDACKKIADSKCSEFSAQINGWTSTASMEGVAYQVQGGGYIEENGKIEIISDSKAALANRSIGGHAICVK